MQRRAAQHCHTKCGTNRGYSKGSHASHTRSRSDIVGGPIHSRLGPFCQLIVVDLAPLCWREGLVCSEL